MSYSNMSDNERDNEFFRDESFGRDEEIARPERRSRRSSSNPESSGDEARKSHRKSKRKSKKPREDMTEEEIRAARRSRRSARMEAEAAGLQIPPGAPDGKISSVEAADEPRASPRSGASGSVPGAHAISGSRGIDEAVKLGEYDDDDDEDIFKPAADYQGGSPPVRPSSAAKKKQEINKDFKDVRETGRWGSISKREMWIVGIVGLLVIIGVVVAVVMLTTGGDEAPPPPPVATPPPAPTAAPTARVVLTAQQQLDAIRGATIDNPTTQDSLPLLPEDVSFYEGKANDPTAAPVVRAASWVMYDDPIDNEDWLVVRYALAVLYYSTSGDAWTTKDGWMTEASACEWHGIRCDRFNKGVEEIDLSGNNLSGSIPNEVNMVSSLISLWMRRNNLSGTVPNVAIGAIPQLSILYLDANNLTGTIGPELAASGSLSKYDAQVYAVSDVCIQRHLSHSYFVPFP
jgi:hypothetical protein